MGAWGSLQEELDCKHEYCAKVQYQPHPRTLSVGSGTYLTYTELNCITFITNLFGVWLILDFCTVLMLAVQLFLQWTSGTHDWDAYLIKWIECYLSHLFPTVNLKIKCWLTYCCSKSAGRLLLTCQVFNDCRMADAPRKRGYQRTVSSDSPQSKKINPSGKDCRKRQTVLQVIGVE